VKFAKQNGAAAVCPLEGQRHLPDSYFYPLYEIATELDLAIAVHIANSNPENADLYRMAPAGRFAQFRVPTVTACFDVIMSELHEHFPKLRWGFIKASAQWVSWVQREAAIRYRVAHRKFPANLLGGIQYFCHLPDQRRCALYCATLWSKSSGYRHRLRPHRSVKCGYCATRVSAYEGNR
jgi:hypothetical protein